MRVIPSKNNLFCKQEDSETISGGFYITENSFDKPLVAKVIESGSKVKEYSKDDRIIYKQYATTDIKIDGEDHFIIDEEDVLGKVL